MTQPELETGSLGAPKRVRTDRWLNVILYVLGVLLVVGIAYFGYTVYHDRQLDESASATGRIAAALASQVRKSPNDAVLRVRLGEAYGAMGKYPQAIEQLNAALKIDPKHTGAYLDLGMIATLTKNYSTAEKYYLKIISLTDGEEYSSLDTVREQAFYNLGMLSLDQKHYTDAAGYFKQSLAIRNDASDTYYELGKALQGMGDPESAIQEVELGLQFDPGFAEAHYFLGQLYKQVHDDVNASYQFVQAAKLAPSAKPPKQALQAYGSADSWIAKARKALGAGDVEAALTAILIARNLDDKSFEAAELHGQILTQRHDVYGALSVYQQAAALSPNNKGVQSEIASLKRQIAKMTPTQRAAAKRAQSQSPTSTATPQ